MSGKPANQLHLTEDTVLRRSPRVKDNYLADRSLMPSNHPGADAFWSKLTDSAETSQLDRTSFTMTPSASRTSSRSGGFMIRNRSGGSGVCAPWRSVHHLMSARGRQCPSVVMRLACAALALFLRLDGVRLHPSWSYEFDKSTDELKTGWPMDVASLDPAAGRTID